MRTASILRLFFVFLIALVPVIVFQNFTSADYKNEKVFVLEDYKAIHPGVTRMGFVTEDDYLNYWLNTGLALGHQASANFSVNDYRDMYPDLAAYSPLQLVDHYLNHGFTEGRAGTKVTSSAMFSQRLYESYNPEYAGLFSSLNEARLHYVKNGFKQASTSFSAAEYRALYPDLASGFANNLFGAAKHYYTDGRKEGRSGLYSRPQTEWFSLLKNERVPPAQVPLTAAGRKVVFAGYDGANSTAFVRVPEITSGVTYIRDVTEDMDATPIFKAKIAELKQNGNHILNLEQNKVYHFKSLDTANNVHLMLEGLEDVTVTGNNATLVFYFNKHGLMIKNSKRVRLINLKIDWSDSLKLYDIGEINRVNGRNILTFSGSDAPTSEQIAAISYFKDNMWQSATTEVYYDTVKLPYVASLGGFTQAFPAKFDTLPEGRYLSRRYTYGGNAIIIFSSDGGICEDININAVRIYAAPGMGIVANGLNRGLRISDSYIERFGSRPISVNSDAFHVINSGGDIILESNYFSYQGDDSVNITSLVRNVTEVISPTQVRVLKSGAQFRPGDRIAFFNEAMGYLGTAELSAANTAASDILDFSAPVAGITTSTKVRNITLSASRYALIGNHFFNHRGRGIVAQTPNGYILQNEIYGTTHGAIAVLSNFTNWLEGTGAVNVSILNNNIHDTRGGAVAAIAIHSEIRSEDPLPSITKLAEVPIHSELIVRGNTVTDSEKSCIYLASSKNTKIENNSCTNTLYPPTYGVVIKNSRGFVLSGNSEVRYAGDSLDPLTTGP